MNLHVLASSSKGNCYVLQNDSEALIIEAGVNEPSLLHVLDYDLKKVAGCILSHEHGDHSRHVFHYLNSGIEVYTSAGTIESLGESHHRLHPVKSERLYMIGRFRVMPFRTEHDCAEPFGFFIRHSDCGNVLFATDTGYLQYTFNDLNQIIIEANYADDILDENIRSGKTPEPIRKRLLGNHMELGVLLDFLRVNDLSKVNNIVLVHLSDGSSDARLFHNKVTEQTGKTVHIAEPGLIVNFNKTPF